nr:hypothetical protein [Tanacetum cinerariifolium]
MLSLLWKLLKIDFEVQEYQEKDKIRSKPDKKRKRGQAGKSQKRLQWKEQEKLKKMQKEGPEMHNLTKFIRRKKFCGNGARVGYNYPAQVPSVQTLPSFPQQYPCCEDSGVTHEPYQCDNIISGLPPFFAITPNEPVLSIEEPDNSLSMGDEHLDTIPAPESDEVIKSSVEDLIPIPKFSWTDDDSFSIDNIDYVEASPPNSEVVSSEVMEIVIPEVGGIEASNDNLIPFYDPIISGIPPNLTPSGEKGDMLLLEAFLNDDHSFDFKTKSSSTSLNSLLEETNNFDNSLPEFTTFSKVLFDHEYESDSTDDQSCSNEDVLEKIISKPLCEEEIIPMKSLRTHDSSLPILSKIDSLLDEFADIEDKDYDSKKDNLIRKDLPRNNTLSFAEKESFYFDIPPFSRPPAKPPDGDTRILNIKMMGDIYDQKAFMHKLMITLVPHQEKSPDPLSHRGLKAF